LTQEQVVSLETNGQLQVELEDEPFVLSVDDVEIVSKDIPGWEVASNAGIVVALDTQLNNELKNEGLARELVNRIQNIRKNSQFEVTDKINIALEFIDELQDVVTSHKNYICEETLAKNLELTNNELANAIELDLDGVLVKIQVEKI
ncbi:MAG: isoleucine--tRNA ligase, partial [Bacteroidetes bacterium]|nr:isoleucine--tRNA ligase [Bacteroidota bacterium]